MNEYGCGKIYKEYIAHENGNKEWYSQALSKTMKFFKFLLKKIQKKVTKHQKLLYKSGISALIIEASTTKRKGAYNYDTEILYGYAGRGI